ncbi:class I SAM-dependent methyltransferase [Romboutsia lituseburensis]|uniref:Demethylmenaquinone methyltransferase / 2-methoxy-6-polyprenyl-1,4-benzoquinol methylase n=1 Tax=Romboutsia lituseburensis DSM 797 TaxID=1121325 RepID=A0A1G9II13_9FIRM|nr:class I SAM-dependent methyltransferase [Romboutsia lituseburensis]CEH33890.1 Methyltransferase type 11 [Romboutsia lituseburensis]SDL24706.1 demethylmenaquinone methyltransferase / 2-methoxy-6-polyprenyl-1,4-benzoquinol methylase [Romboutsia lituseburensis DSM 797]
MEQRDFFDSIAKEWDNIIEVNEEKINTLLSKVDIKDNDNILDVGTGTGVLIPFLKNLNTKGIIKGVDISSGMLDIASQKFKDTKNVSFEALDIENSSLEEKYDKIILYSMFPHLKNKTNTIKILVENNLNKDGKLIIAHSNSREFLNNMHKEKDKSVSEDRLIPIKDQKTLFEQVNLNVLDAYEDDEIYYLVVNKK